MYFGAHLSITGGYKYALEKISSFGGNCLQIFSTSPRGWNIATISASESSEFLHRKKQLSIAPIFFHASYLLNLADAGRIGAFSKKSLKAELTLASTIGIEGSIIHTGSFKGEQTKEKMITLLKNIEEIIESTPENSFLILENAGTRKIGRNLDELGLIIKNLKSKRMKVCLDTCHLHAAGYDVSTPVKLDEFITYFDAVIGIENLAVFHMNDSKDVFGSLRDRHENIGEGYVGNTVFSNIINHPKLKGLPFIIETPGFEKTGPDKRNLDILKRMIQE